MTNNFAQRSSKQVKTAAHSAAEETPEGDLRPKATSTEPRPSPAITPTDRASLSWGMGELHDIGPAGPASAWARGLVMVNKANELVLLPLDGRGRFTEIEAEDSSFAKYGRGPAVTEHYAYWIDLRGKLIRAALKSPKDVEVLHASARRGTRVSALRSGPRELVAFVAELDGNPVSMLWTGDGEPLRLSPEGSAATSVGLVVVGRGILAVTLAGRTGMSPLHARPLRIAPRRVNLGDDQVVWVGPGSHPLTELEVVTPASDRATVFLAAARTITEFGLAHFSLGETPKPVDEARWRSYPNGIDPAPVAAAQLCGKAYVFYAQPATAQPRSPQELRVAAIENEELGAAEVIAHGRAFNDISVAARPRGATLVWTADRHTWATTLRCPDRQLSGTKSTR